MHDWHKAVWVLIIGAFLFLEFRAVHNDRVNAETQRAEIRKEERQSFKDILEENHNHLQQILQSNEAQWKLTIDAIASAPKLRQSHVGYELCTCKDEALGGKK